MIEFIQNWRATQGAGPFPEFEINRSGDTLIFCSRSIGEESGALDSMLEKSATYYEEMVDTAVDGLTSLIEPFIMAFLGVVVGVMMVAMYLPIFQIGRRD